MSHHPCKNKHLYSPYGTPHKSKWYINKKRRLRQKMAVSLRWKIKNDDDCYGLFKTDQYIKGCASWIKANGNQTDDSISHWADILFMSQKDIREGIFYNAMISTVADEIYKDIEDEVYEEIEKITKGMTYKEREDMYGKVFFQKIPGSQYSEMKSNPAKPLKLFGGKTVHGFEADLLKEKLEHLSVRKAFISCEKDYTYAYGVGLHMVTDAIGINFTSIVDTIEYFRNHNENDYREEVNISPHIPAIKVKILMNIHVKEVMEAKGQGKEPPTFDASLLSEEEKRHYHIDSAMIKNP